MRVLLTDDSKWKLIWHDEFDTELGDTPDPGRWGYDLGGHGWGNKELQVYTSLPENACVVVDADAAAGKSLAITAIKKPDGGYTSARLVTRHTFQSTYGRYEARIKMSAGQGIWPAFWLLGGNMSEVGWPKCGEIDIMEWIGRVPGTGYGTLHGPGYSGKDGIQGKFPATGEAVFSGEYHAFSVDWSPNLIEWHIDGVQYHKLTPADLPNGAPWVYDHDFYIILNLAVGGSWPEYPDDSTTFPQSLNIDYVRVYQSLS